MFKYRTAIEALARASAFVIQRKDADYGGSWQKRGGANAYAMLVRKWDRLENAAKKHNGDIFAALHADDRPEGLIDDIRDLRNYLSLVEAWAFTEVGNTTFPLELTTDEVYTCADLITGEPDGPILPPPVEAEVVA